ncbi:MAG: AAA family ATPase [Dehalococcoidia bacterium]|nr:AAA family ATPase [Dehalococcoidia bacterium]
MSKVEDCKEYGETAAEILKGPFSGLSLQCASDALGKELWAEEPTEAMINARGRVMRATTLADGCSKVICDEVIRDSQTHNYIPGPDIRGYLQHPHADLEEIRVLRGMGIDTNDPRNFKNLSMWEEPSYSAYHEDADSVPIYLGHLSSGTEGTLLWIRWLALKMVVHYGFAEGWERKPAILLIDEIENHLHPTWQRRVIPALLEHFPKLQIFATTHSPFVVAGLKAGQVHLLHRDENGCVTATTNSEDVVGWTADEILRTMMGVDEPTDQITVHRANRLRQLRGRETLTPEEETELNELRRQVNKDLLSKGGLLETQRERYADLVQDFLRARESELTQDGG